MEGAGILRPGDQWFSSIAFLCVSVPPSLGVSAVKPGLRSDHAPVPGAEAEGEGVGFDSGEIGAFEEGAHFARIHEG